MTGIICAMKLEAENILASMTNIKEESHGGITFFAGRLHEKDAVVAVCDVGGTKLCEHRGGKVIGTGFRLDRTRGGACTDKEDF